MQCSMHLEYLNGPTPCQVTSTEAIKLITPHYVVLQKSNKYWSNKIYHDKNPSPSPDSHPSLSLHLDEVPKNVVKRHALHDNLTSSDYKSNVCQPPELPPPVIRTLSNQTKTYQTFYTYVHTTNIQHYDKWSLTQSAVWQMAANPQGITPQSAMWVTNPQGITPQSAIWQSLTHKVSHHSLQCDSH